MLVPDLQSTKELATEKNTKAPEGATTGATAGGAIGGTFGLLAGIGALAIPGLGPFIAAGPIMGALAGVGAGAATGGLWGTEFWAASSQGGTDGGNTFYLAYRDNSADGAARAEAGTVDNLNLAITSLEFDPQIIGTPAMFGGTCFSTTPPSPCTLTVSVPLSALGISSGNGLYGLTGLSTYFFGSTNRPPLLRVELGNSEQADATAPIDYLGSGTP